MGTNGPWNWRLTVPNTIKLMLLRPLMTNLKMTVGEDCAVSTCSPPPPVYKSSHPLLGVGWSRLLGRCPPPSPNLPHPLKQKAQSPSGGSKDICLAPNLRAKLPNQSRPITTSKNLSHLWGQAFHYFFMSNNSFTSQKQSPWLQDTWDQQYFPYLGSQAPVPNKTVHTFPRVFSGQDPS